MHAAQEGSVASPLLQSFRSFMGQLCMPADTGSNPFQFYMPDDGEVMDEEEAEAAAAAQAAAEFEAFQAEAQEAAEAEAEAAAAAELEAMIAMQRQVELEQQ